MAITSSHFFQLLINYRYFIAFPLAVVEGPVVMMIAGFMVHIGIFDFWPMYFVMVAGDLTGDVMWYWIGRRGGRPLIDKYGKWVNISQENVDRMEKMFHNHETKILFISKLTTGFGFALAVLLAAGVLKINFKKYITINFLGEFIWAAFLFVIGFSFANLYGVFSKDIKWLSLLALVILGAGIIYGFSKVMRAKFGDRFPRRHRDEASESAEH